MQVLADDNMATKLLFTGAMTGELEEAYKILMLGGVDVRFSGLTRELEAEVWRCIRKVRWQAVVQRSALNDGLCVRWLRSCSALASTARGLRP